MIQVRENRSFTSRFIAVAAAVTAIFSFVILSIPLAFELPLFLRFLGIVSIIAWLMSVLLNRYLWRVRPFSWFLRIPDLSGRWEGWYRRSATDPWRETAHEISQRALDINAEAWGPRNWSRGTCSALVVTSHDLTVELVWAYKTEPTSVDYNAGDIHNGVHFLRMVERDGQQLLVGKYINDRPHEHGKGAVGEIQLRRVPHKLLHELHFNEASWGLKRPQP